MQELEEAVDMAVEEYLLEKEHEEFIRLLRYFVEVQEPRLPAVGVRCDRAGSFALVDGDGNPLAQEQLEPLLGALGQEGIEAEDFVISALIALAPRSVVIHRPADRRQEFMETVRSIFGARLTVCSGCPRCGDHASRGREGES